MATNDRHGSTAPQVFAGKVITVTGAARGLGLATARYLVRRGATVILSDVLEAELKEAAEELAKEGEVSTAVVDIKNRESVEGWLKGVKEKYGKIDAAVNNAGIFSSASIVTIDDADFDRVMAINVKGTLNCLRAEIPLIQDGGSIVNVASIAGLHGLPLMGLYAASKHAVVGLTKVAAKETADRGIRVNAVCPGVVGTEMANVLEAVSQGTFSEAHAGSWAALKRYGHPEEVASLVAYLAGDESKFVTGSNYTCDGGWLVN